MLQRHVIRWLPKAVLTTLILNQPLAAAFPEPSASPGLADLSAEPEWLITCDTSSTTPSTILSNDNQTVVLFPWHHNMFASSNYSLSDRCIDASQKINDLYEELGEDLLIFYGQTEDGLGLSAVESVWGRYKCRTAGLILSLDSGNDPARVFQDLIVASAPPLANDVSRGDRPIALDNWINTVLIP
jgi:hypothetical protein